ncbi:MAG: hypothetical protein E4H27_06845 [Anaerolineales bacterium]|nr:MAG: hypothetical protein E4H27_06845 [Anaerolineales bacterium]
MMVIDLSKLHYTFLSKPLLIGGKAMEYYDLRQAGNDIDYVITAEDYEQLAQQYPDHLRDLWGDLGVCVYEFEIWKSICLFDYAYLSGGAVDVGAYMIISLEKLLFLKALGIEVGKYRADLGMIVKKILDAKYAVWWAQLSDQQQAHYLAQK